MTTNVQILPDQVIDAPGYLLFLQLEEGHHGVIRVVSFGRLEVTNIADESQCEMYGTRLWEGAQEPKEWDVNQRKVQPMDRQSPSLYIPHTFAQMDIRATCDGSRFLSRNEATMHEWLRHYFRQPDTFAYYIETIKELGDTLIVALARIGVPEKDREGIKQDILGKILRL